MKKLITLIFTLYCLHAFSQNAENILKGKVLKHSFDIQDTKFSPIAGVEVKGGYANPTVSVTNGDYKLIFYKMQAGEAIALSVYKAGYEVVNEEDLQTKIPKHSKWNG